MNRTHSEEIIGAGSNLTIHLPSFRLMEKRLSELSPAE